MDFGAAMFFTDYSMNAAELAQALEARQGSVAVRRWWENRRADPGAAAPRPSGRQLHRGLFPPHDAADHQSRSVMGRKPQLLSPGRRHPAPRSARVALATRRSSIVLHSVSNTSSPPEPGTDHTPRLSFQINDTSPPKTGIRLHPRKRESRRQVRSGCPGPRFRGGDGN